jgi:hypothetical protein
MGGNWEKHFELVLKGQKGDSTLERERIGLDDDMGKGAKWEGNGEGRTKRPKGHSAIFEFPFITNFPFSLLNFSLIFVRLFKYSRRVEEMGISLLGPNLPIFFPSSDGHIPFICGGSSSLPALLVFIVAFHFAINNSHSKASDCLCAPSPSFPIWASSIGYGGKHGG